MIKKEDFVKVGRFGKPHGIKGEINLVVTEDIFPDDYKEPYVVCEMDGICVPFFIESYRYKSDTTLLVKMETFDSEDAVRKFINLDVYCPPEAVVEDNDIQLSWSDFVGYTILDQVAGRLGEVTGIEESTANVLFIVDYNGEELFIPAADELMVDIDEVNKLITTSLPDGLLDL